ncbi:MAG: glycosyltransferase [Polyangiaceae bacterium]
MSLPAQTGYSIRTSYIIKGQAKLGYESYGVTSARHPKPEASVEVVEGVSYRRTPELTGPQPPLVREARLMSALFRSASRAIRDWKPDIVHAHSPMLVGLPAMLAARRHRLPFVYEVRDLWENASVVHGKFREGSLQYRLARGGDTRVFQNADAVVTICQAMRDHIAPRVGRLTDLHVIANGVTAGNFVPQDPSPELLARYGVEGKRLFGFLGSFEPWEGLPDLIAAVPKVVAEVRDAHLIVVGGGHMDQPVRDLVKQRRLDAHVTFTGRVPHAEVQQLLALPELLVYPRVSSLVTELTTPIKPLEAMAMARPVLVSDVKALLELARPGETGLAFRAGDVDDLARNIVKLLDDAELRQRLGRNARAYVERERDWDTLVAGYADVYRAARAKAAA